MQKNGFLLRGRQIYKVIFSIIIVVSIFLAFSTASAGPMTLNYSGEITTVYGDTTLQIGDSFDFEIRFDDSFYGPHSILNDQYFDFILTVPGILPWIAKDDLVYGLSPDEPMVEFDTKWNLIDALYVDSESGLQKRGNIGTGNPDDIIFFTYLWTYGFIGVIDHSPLNSNLNPMATPEPSTFLLFFLGLTGIVYLSRSSFSQQLGKTA